MLEAGSGIKMAPSVFLLRNHSGTEAEKKEAALGKTGIGGIR
jgi:hypothetical protein